MIPLTRPEGGLIVVGQIALNGNRKGFASGTTPADAASLAGYVHAVCCYESEHYAPASFLLPLPVPRKFLQVHHASLL